MLKADLVRMLKAEFPEYTNADLKEVLDLVFDQMSAALCRGHRIEIRGFGSFAVHVQKKREFINPKNGRLTCCPERYRIVFRPGKNLKKVHGSGAGK